MKELEISAKELWNSQLKVTLKLQSLEIFCNGSLEQMNIRQRSQAR
jgi:hypothetical protein